MNAPELLTDEALEASAVVANNAMNREREIEGPNGYDRDLGFDVLAFLRERLASGREPRWLDLCCGSGRALVQAAARCAGQPVRCVGVDLVGMFVPTTAVGVELVATPLRAFRPTERFDLVTCVHGLHYVGDKLGAVARACGWLTDDGRFAAHLDLDHVVIQGGAARRRVPAALRAAGLAWDRRRHLVTCRGRRDVRLPFRYLGADDTVGPNYTGQAAVASHYEPA